MPFHYQLKYLVIPIILIIAFHSSNYSQCAGIHVDAGPDLFTCDPNQILQLKGSVQGNYSKFYWTPTSGLSDPNILDPTVTTKIPGKYKFKLTAEGLSTANLIINGDFESGNTGFSTGYTYNTINTTEGEYFVGTNPSAWNGGFSPCGDHTTGSGNMLLLNGHPVAGTNCWCQTVTTVIGRIYQFEFWSQSLYPTNIAQLNVKLNGNPIGSTQAGLLCDWERFVVTFTASSTSTALCISETSGIRAGNDFALDDIALYEKCVDMDDVTVEIVNLLAKIDIPFKPKCSSDIFDLTAIGSSTGPNISYEWSTDIGKIISQNGLSAKGKGSGIYTIKVIYTNNNVMCETEAFIEYIAPEVLAGTLNGSGKVTCLNDSILLKANMSSGSGLYNYKWAPDTSILKGQNSDSVFINKARRYTVTITDQTSGCTIVLDYDVNADTLRPLVQIKGDTLLDCRKSNAILKSNQSDSVKYFIRWIVPDLSIIKNRSSIIDSLIGNYKLIIEDNSNHCRDSTQWNIAIDTIHPSLDLGNDLNIDCKNDSVIVTNKLNNQAGNISYYWSIDNNQLIKENILQNKKIVKSSRIKLRLVNETNGCEASDSLFVSDSRAVPILEAGKNELLTCKTKQIQLHANVNLNDSLIISWTSPLGNIISGINTTQPFVDKKGWYFIHIANQTNGCENQDSLFVDENTLVPSAILGPDLMFSCIDTVKIIDGSNSSFGANFIYQWSSTNGNIKSGNGTNKIIVISPGAYKLVLKDTINGCSDSAFINVNPDLNKPIVSIAKTDTLSCTKTDIVLSASANSQTGNLLDFIWSNNSGAPIQSPKSLQTLITVPGIYFFTATDQSNGCSSTAQTIVNIDTLRPSIEAGSDLVWNCASTKYSLKGVVLNNSSSYTYEWSTINGGIIGNPDNKDIEISSPGSYIFFVIDEINGCSTLDSLAVIPDLAKPVIIIKTPDTLNCFHNVIPINGKGSSSGIRYAFLWTSNNGNIIGKPNMNSIQVDKPGLYKLFIIDTTNKCNQEDSVIVFEDKATPDISIQIPLELTCSRKLVKLDAIINNIVPNYFANWSTTNGNLIPPGNTLQCSVDKAGRYFFRIQSKDNGCENLDSIDVFENTNIPIDFSFTVEQPICSGEKGTITILNIAGGQNPYTYFLDNILVNGSSLQNLAAGLKNIRIVDANGCAYSKDIFIMQPSNVGVSLPPLVKLNFGENYIIKPSFSIPIDSIAWIIWTPVDHLSCSDCIEPTVIKLDKETSYSLSYANKQGCVATADILIQIIKRGIWIPNSFSPNGDNINDWFYPIIVEESYNRIRTMSIYDRWGELVFQRDNFQPNAPAEGWNGEFKHEKLNPGVYVYIVEVEWKNGETQILKGDVTLIR